MKEKLDSVCRGTYITLSHASPIVSHRRPSFASKARPRLKRTALTDRTTAKVDPPPELENPR